MVTIRDNKSHSALVPGWADRYLTSGDFSLVAAAIHTAELETSVEIVPIVVHRSAVAAHVPMILVLIFLLVVSLFWPVLNLPEAAIWPALLLVALGIVAVLQLSQVQAVRNIFTDDTDLATQAFRRAELEFYAAGMNKTNDRIGILLFISLAERYAVVLADKGISDVLPDTTWASVCELLTAGAKNRKLAEGISAAVLRCSALARDHFPAGDSNPNELANCLIVKE